MGREYARYHSLSRPSCRFDRDIESEGEEVFMGVRVLEKPAHTYTTTTRLMKAGEPKERKRVEVGKNPDLLTNKKTKTRSLPDLVKLPYPLGQGSPNPH